MGDYRFYLDRVLTKKKLQDNYALRFDGVDDYCEVPDSLSAYSFIQNTLVFTIKTRVRFINLNDRNLFFGNNLGTANQKGIFGGLENFGEFGIKALRINITNGVNNRNIDAKTQDNVINDNEYHEIIYRCPEPGNNIEILVDGVSLSVIYLRPFDFLSNGDSSDNLNMGLVRANASARNVEIDYIKIWNQYKTDDSDTGLVSHWKFNEGTGCIAADSVGGYDANLMPDCPTNSPEWIKL